MIWEGLDLINCTLCIRNDILSKQCRLSSYAAVSDQGYTVCIHPAILNTFISSKIDLLKRNTSRKHAYILLTPLIVNLGFTRVYIIFLIFAQNMDCEYQQSML